VVLAPAGQANEKVVFPQEVHPIRAGKNQLQDKKHSAFPQKKKRFYPQEVRPIRGGTAPTGHELSLSGIAAKRQPAANGWAVAPAGQAATNKPSKRNPSLKEKTALPIRGTHHPGRPKSTKQKRKKPQQRTAAIS
jgi:hypothetical protein